MATYTSTQSGKWDEPSTWGGAGFPSVAGDAAVVSAGHTIVYNVSSDVELGAITIAGLLSFATDLTTKLTLGNAKITINNGGELRIGADGAVITDGCLCEVLWNTTSDNANGITINNGGKLSLIHI